MRLLDADGRSLAGAPGPDAALVRAVGRAWRWRSLLTRGVHATAEALAKAEGVTAPLVHRQFTLAYLAPDLLSAILDGRQRPGLTLDQVLQTDLPLDWASQRRLLSARGDA